VDTITAGREKIERTTDCDRIVDEWKESAENWPALPVLAKDDWDAYLEKAIEQFNHGMEGLRPLIG